MVGINQATHLPYLATHFSYLASHLLNLTTHPHHLATHIPHLVIQLIWPPSLGHQSPSLCPPISLTLPTHLPHLLHIQYVPHLAPISLT